MSPPDDGFWMLDRQKVRAFVEEERAELDTRVARGDIFEQVQLDQRDVFIDMISGLPTEHSQVATDLYLEEKAALYNSRMRKAQLVASALESGTETGAEEVSRAIGIVIAAALLLFLFFGSIALMRGG